MYERHLKIIELVRTQEYVSVQELAQYFNVTLQTIRRDVNKLSKEGLITRYHGGAGLIQDDIENAVKGRKTQLSSDVEKIASTVAEHIPNASSLFINVGDASEETAKALLGKERLTVITNNITVAEIFRENESIETVLTGGVVRKKDWAVTGESTVEFIKQFKVDFGIIGVAGIDPDGTLLDYDYNEVRVARAIIKNARKVFLVADHSRFDHNAIVCLCHISEVDTFFTDRMPPADIKNILTASGVNLVVADNSDSEEETD